VIIPPATPWTVPTDALFTLDQVRCTPPDDAPGKKAAKRALRDKVEELDDLQRRLYADDRHSVLLVFQAMDAAGKDSTIRAVFTGVNPSAFQVTSFTVQGNMMLTRQQILESGGLSHGVNLLALDAGGVERSISSQPWIEWAELKKVWPSSVEVRVRERRPLALVNLDLDGSRELFYLDRSGKVFQPLRTVGDLDYPVDYYVNFLQYLKDRYTDIYHHTKPKEIARFFKQRNRSTRPNYKSSLKGKARCFIAQLINRHILRNYSYMRINWPGYWSNTQRSILMCSH